MLWPFGAALRTSVSKVDRPTRCAQVQLQHDPLLGCLASLSPFRCLASPSSGEPSEAPTLEVALALLTAPLNRPAAFQL
uniref:Uncharacterized protein n=1 Tax=Trichuris muris TaxID=70415 RepID=A0A5S6QX13_TRIMR